MVPDLFQSHAERAPLAPAVVTAEGTMTYDELRVRSGHIAAALAARGVGRGSLVGVCVERDANLVPALLGVMRAGGAYIPIDPHFPAARVKQMLDDARPTVVLASRETLKVLEGAAESPIVVEEVPPADAPPAPSLTERDLAYVIYTSGSTGKPKGVMVEHGGLSNILTSMADLITAGPTDRLLAVTTVSFDIAGLELFMPLISGGTVVLARRKEALDGRVLARMLEKQQITILQATPATWRMLVDGGWPGRPGLRALVGGEALPRTLANELAARVDVLWNVYGPTETTIWSTAHRVTAGDGPVPIGKALARTTLKLLDEDLRPADEGELCIGGAGVARGYLNRDELTAERFIGDPEAPGERVYRTGDLCRWGADGALEFIGRRDHQVKIRGYRVELGDVESALGQHPAIAEVIAGVRDTHENKVLVAYVRLRDGASLTLADLRHWAGDRLPQYMLPTALIPVQEMPRTPAGKTDRAALASMHAQAVAAPHRVVIPEARDDLDLIVLTVFREILGLDTLTAEDDFFDAGGHSLMAFRAVQEIEKRTGRAVDVAFMFEHSTVTGLAQVLRERGGMAVPATVIDLQPQGEEPPLFCVCGVALYLPLARALAPNQPVVAVYVDVDLNLFHNDRGPTNLITVEAIAERYAEQIRRHRPKGPYRLLGFSIGGAVAYEVARRLMADGDKVEMIAMIDSYLADSIYRKKFAYAVHAARKMLSKGPGWAIQRVKHKLGLDRAKGRPPVRPTLCQQNDAAQRKEIEARGDAVVATYQATPLDVRVLLFNAEDRPRQPYEVHDESGGWLPMVGQHRFKLVYLPGDHTDLLPTPTGSAAIAKHIREFLGAGEGAASSNGAR